MKFIKLECKSAGFQYGDTAEIGEGEGKISEEAAAALVEAGLAKEVKEAVASSGSANTGVAALEATVKKLTEDNTALEATVKKLTEDGDKALLEEIERLKGFLDEAIDSAKGKVPAGYVKG